MKSGSSGADLENLLLFHSVFRTIDFFDSGSFSRPSHRPLPRTEELNVVRPVARDGQKEPWLVRASKKSRLVLMRISLASSCYGQKGRVEASV